MAKDEEEFKGPEVSHDDLLAHIGARHREEYARKSDAAESGDKTQKFLEETGLNGQALKWAGSIIKKLPKKDGQAKAMDIIRSLDLILPMIKDHVEGQGTGEMDLGPDPEDPDGVDAGGDDNQDDDGGAAAEPEVEEASGGDPDLGTVDETVTPIDFGGDGDKAA